MLKLFRHFPSISFISVFAAAITLVSGCAAFKVREKNEAAVAQVSSVAIVAFDGLEPVSAGIAVDLSNVGKVSGAAGGGIGATTTDAIMETLWAALASSLEKNLNWKVMPRKAMSAHPAYRKAFDRSMSGFQNKMPTAEGTRLLLVSEVMDTDGPRILGEEGRRDLARALGVDAIVTVRLDTRLNSTTIMGIGNRYPQTRASLRVHSREAGEVIWFDGSVEGQPSDRSVGKTAFIDSRLMDELMVECGRDAISKIGMPTRE